MERATRPTMRDVAALAGVSLKTVSRVVNGEGTVRPEAASAVQAAITDLGYRRNEAARRLRQGATATVGLVVGDLADPSSAPLARQVEDVACRHGYQLFVASCDGDPGRERAAVLALMERRVEGLLLVPAGDDHRYLLPEVRAGTPVVAVERPVPELDCDCVVSDGRGGAAAAVRHLAAHGHRRIALVDEPPAAFPARERLAGYRHELRQAGLDPTGARVLTVGGGGDSAAEALAELLAQPSAPSAVITGTSRITVAVRRLLDAGGPAPALVGFDGLGLAGAVGPRLTLVVQDPARMGREAAELLFGRLAGHRGPGRLVAVPTRLVPGGSGETPP